MSTTAPTLDPAASQVLALLAGSGAPTLDQLDPPAAREALKALLGLQAPKAAVAEVRDLAADGAHGPIPLRLYRPRGSAATEALPVLVYFHAGGWVIGDIEICDALCRRIANAARCAVVSVEYRLAPEHKFPAAVDDAYAATCWVAQHAPSLGLGPSRIAVGGDSAGGNLAAVVSLLARDRRGPRLALQVLLYPVTDLHGGTQSRRSRGEGYFLTDALMRYFVDHYASSAADLDDWRGSPLLARDHAGLPPACVIVCGFDPLHDEGVAYAHKLQAAGVSVELHDFEGQIHAFLLMDGAIAQAATAIESIGAALRRAFAMADK
ncbi:MAG: alpha/beta hydrolase [Rudaea sp.]|uniref:alpha/beta hydrolase n=1 Tax=Rudaea sp. TaxID=2136325 RepID=UPI0039E3AEBE